jgi:membrane associated rhomboid family serine protease
MLFPIGDDNQGRVTTPYVTYILIALNIAVFFLLQMPNDAFTYAFSVVPREVTTGVDISAPGIRLN